ncbi:hypothetical protein ACKKBF_B03940 [Auxenochlorella protothecoides x Auxenochlorella symbiontica]
MTVAVSRAQCAQSREMASQSRKRASLGTQPSLPLPPRRICMGNGRGLVASCCTAQSAGGERVPLRRPRVNALDEGSASCGVGTIDRRPYLEQEAVPRPVLQAPAQHQRDQETAQDRQHAHDGVLEAGAGWVRGGGIRGHSRVHEAPGHVKPPGDAASTPNSPPACQSTTGDTALQRNLSGRGRTRGWGPMVVCRLSRETPWRASPRQCLM